MAFATLPFQVVAAAATATEDHSHPTPHVNHPIPLHYLNLSGGASEDIGVTGIQDSHGGASEELSTGSSKLDL